jgi:rhodanese-related sulfurtransferase
MSKNRNKHGKKKTQSVSPFLLLGIVAVVAIAIVGIWILNREGASDARLPDQISISQALAKREDGAFILDVREPEEWQEYHIPESTLIPLGELKNRVNELPRDQEIVVVCRSGNRSQAGREILAQSGFNRVTSMAGGLIEWKSAGHPTVIGN